MEKRGANSIHLISSLKQGKTVGIIHSTIFSSLLDDVQAGNKSDIRAMQNTSSKNAQEVQNNSQHHRRAPNKIQYYWKSDWIRLNRKLLADFRISKHSPIIIFGVEIERWEIVDYKCLHRAGGGAGELDKLNF